MCAAPKRGGRPLKPLDQHTQGRGRFGVALRNARTGIPGLSQGRLASELSRRLGRNVGRSYITRIELGELLPPFDLVVAAEAELGSGGTLRAAWERVYAEEHDHLGGVVGVPRLLLAGLLEAGVGADAADSQRLDLRLLAAAERARATASGLGRVGLGVAGQLDRVTARWRRLDDTHGAAVAGLGVTEHIQTISALLPSAASEETRSGLLAARSSAKQLAGWCAWEEQNLTSALDWTAAAVRDATLGGDISLAAYALGRSATYLLRSGRIAEAMADVGPIWQVATLASTPPLVASCLVATCANLLAAGGDQVRALRAAEWSRRAYERHSEGQDDAPDWLYFWTRAQMHEWLGRAAAVLGRWDDAARDLEASLASLPPGYPREVGVVLTALAEVRVGQGDLEAAWTLTGQALDVAERFSSQRGVTRAAGVYGRLQQVAPQAPATRRAGERLRTAQQRLRNASGVDGR